VAPRIMRRIGLDGNPMRRRVDRVQAWARLAVLVVLVVAGPVPAWSAGSRVYARAATLAPAFPARAVVVRDAPFPATPYPMVVLPDVLAPATWTAPDGTVHSGLIAVAAGTPAGTAVRVWTDARGDPVAAPDRAQAATDATVAGAGAATGTVLLFAAAWLVLRRALDRRRMAAWRDGWAEVEPRWSGRV
jgi:hypothetical protein